MTYFLALLGWIQALIEKKACIVCLDAKHKFRCFWNCVQGCMGVCLECYDGIMAASQDITTTIYETMQMQGGPVHFGEQYRTRAECPELRCRKYEEKKNEAYVSSGAAGSTGGSTGSTDPMPAAVPAPVLEAATLEGNPRRGRCVFTFEVGFLEINLAPEVFGWALHAGMDRGNLFLGFFRIAVKDLGDHDDYFLRMLYFNRYRIVALDVRDDEDEDRSPMIQVTTDGDALRVAPYDTAFYHSGDFNFCIAHDDPDGDGFDAIGFPVVELAEFLRCNENDIHEAATLVLDHFREWMARWPLLNGRSLYNLFRDHVGCTIVRTRIEDGELLVFMYPEGRRR